MGTESICSVQLFAVCWRVEVIEYVFVPAGSIAHTAWSRFFREEWFTFLIERELSLFPPSLRCCRLCIGLLYLWWSFPIRYRATVGVEQQRREYLVVLNIRS